MTRDQRLAQLEADLANSSGRAIRIAEIWARDESGESKLDRYVDLRTDDLLELLRERRELRARCLEAYAIGKLRWSVSGELELCSCPSCKRIRRGNRLVRHYAAAIREGRL